MRTLILTAATLLLTLSCQLPVPQGTTARASLAVSASLPSARTILPPAMPAASYRLSGTGPAGETFGPLVSSVGTFTAGNLSYGSWTLTLDGFDGTGATGNLVLTGTATASIVSPNASAAVILTPLSVGTGTLAVTLSWPASDTEPDVITATLDGLGTTVGSHPLTFLVTGHAASANGTFTAGTYLLTVRGSHSGVEVLAPRTETVLLYNGQTSSWTAPLNSTDLGAPGSLVFDGGTAASWGSIVTPVFNDAVLTSDRSGTANAAYAFSGTEHVETAYAFPTGTAAKSFSVWFKPTAVADRGWILDGGSQSGADATAFGLFFHGGVLNFHGQGGAYDQVFSKSFVSGVYYHVAVTYDGTTLIGYVNGVQDFSVARTLATASGPTWIGARNSVDETSYPAQHYGHFIGTIDRIRVFNTALSGSQVTDLAAASAPVATWAQSLSPSMTGAAYNSFAAVATDGAGSTFAGGLVRRALTYRFGLGVPQTVTTTSDNANWWDGYSAVLVKYNAAGEAVAAQTVTNTTHTDSSDVEALAYDATSGSLYAAANVNGSALYTFPGGITLQGRFSAGPNVGIVKLNATTLNAVWASTVATPVYSSVYTAVAVDAAGNPYAGGRMLGPGGGQAFNFGNGVTAATLPVYVNDWLVVKYDKNTGLAQWAKTTTSGTADSGVTGLACDPAGSIAAVGNFSGLTALNFGGPSLTGVAPSQTAALVKYSPGGTVAWAAAPLVAPGSSAHTAVTSDAAGNWYVVGRVIGNGTFDLGNGAAVVTANTNGLAANLYLAKYSSGGTPLWLRSIVAGNGSSQYNAISVDASGNLIVAGTIEGTLSYNLGNGVLVQGTSTASNALLAAYNDAGTPLWARTVSSGSAPTVALAVATDASTRQISLAGRMSGTDAASFDDKAVAPSGRNSSDRNNGDPANILLVRY